LSSLLTHPSGTRPIAALASLSLPVSLLIALGLGVAMMGIADCAHVSPVVAKAAATILTIAAGALLTSFGGNLIRARRSRRLAEAASVEVEDPDRLADVERLANAMGVPAPTLLAVISDRPLAVSLLGRRPAILVSTWVFDHLTQGEWQAVIAHELAHQRPDDMAVRWLGTWLLGAGRRVPGFQAAWSRLDVATEEAADRAAIDVLGSETDLQSARRKFGDAGGASAQLVWTPLRHQLAIAALGAVISLPLVPFVAVPVCMYVCAR
jgi:Zn-dependent protease with chaperone function